MFYSENEEAQVTVDWLIFFSSFVVITAVLGCVCGCRKRSDKASTAKRSLPDIPSNEIRGIDEAWYQPLVAGGDNCSELYATVDDTNLNASANKSSKRRVTASATSTDNSTPEICPENSHEYAKLTHPYARVQPVPPNNNVTHNASNSQSSGDPENSMTSPHVQEGSDTTHLSSADQPVPPPRTRRSSMQSNVGPGQSASHLSVHRLSGAVDSSSNSSSSYNIADTISAAPAILGHISASQELPYITLPLPDGNIGHNPMPAERPASSNETETVRDAVIPHIEENATNFSGDSQDSGKGYTSISVREPLSSIRSLVPNEQHLEQQAIQPRNHSDYSDPLPQQEQQRPQHKPDPHYAVVSDDSDDMYAAIEDQQGSDMYAQVVPPPPSIDSLRTRVVDSHSQQASSSANNAVANVGSPKPEKRQANSPLPPPPLLQTSNTGSATSDEIPLPSKLEDMYAKVMKKKSVISITDIPLDHKNPQKEITFCGKEVQNMSGDKIRHEIQNSENLLEPNYESASCSIQDAQYASLQNSNDDPGYEIVQSKVDSNNLSNNPKYEECKRKDPNSEPNYELLEDNPNYEQLATPKFSNDPNDPNYELVGEKDEPPYELLSTESSSTVNSDILYATVNKLKK